MSDRFVTKATLIALEILMLGAFTLWYVSPVRLVGGIAHPVEIRAARNTNTLVWNFDEAQIYDSLEELRADFDQVEIEPQAVDFARQKLVCIEWKASGYYTDEMRRSDGSVEPVFGEIRHDVSCGGKRVEFYLARETPGSSLFGVTVHSVFAEQVGVDWFAVPKEVAVHYRDTNASELVFGLVFLASCYLIVRTCLTRRRNKIPVTDDNKVQKADPVDHAPPESVSELAEAAECPVP